MWLVQLHVYTMHSILRRNGTLEIDIVMDDKIIWISILQLNIMNFREFTSTYSPQTDNKINWAIPQKGDSKNIQIHVFP